MKLSVPHTLRKHNGMFASILTLVILISGSLQLVHDQLLDHHHTVDCPMFVLDGSPAAAGEADECSATKQAIEEHLFTPLSLVLSQLESNQARAPPRS